MARQIYIEMKTTVNEGVEAGQGIVHNFKNYVSYFVILTISLLYIHRCRPQYALGADSITRDFEKIDQQVKSK